MSRLLILEWPPLPQKAIEAFVPVFEKWGFTIDYHQIFLKDLLNVESKKGIRLVDYEVILVSVRSFNNVVAAQDELKRFRAKIDMTAEKKGGNIRLVGLQYSPLVLAGQHTPIKSSREMDIELPTQPLAVFDGLFILAPGDIASVMRQVCASSSATIA